mmetsp:Transcript_12534/g.27203  ORF Transcript_12534/g.27203 Transcript_12534/m.27203 type:complete len:174 (-) Transcript_12534:3105-3626(-)
MMKLAINIILTLMLLPTTAFAHLKGTKQASTTREKSITTKEEYQTNRTINRKAQSTESTANHGPSPEELCSAFMIYDFLTRKMQHESSNYNIDWSSVCPPLQDLNPQLCPTGQYLLDICTEPYRVDLNPSVRYDYCEPLLARIDHEKDRLHCVRACIRYVSRERGDCCQFECE